MRRQRGQLPDVYQYKELPNPLRVQIIHIWRDVLGHPRGDQILGVADEASKV
jgi:hypothetical protein